MCISRTQQFAHAQTHKGIPTPNSSSLHAHAFSCRQHTCHNGNAAHQRCNTMQHTATLCNKLQPIATHTHTRAIMRDYTIMNSTSRLNITNSRIHVNITNSKIHTHTNTQTRTHTYADQILLPCAHNFLQASHTQ